MRMAECLTEEGAFSANLAYFWHFSSLVEKFLYHILWKKPNDLWIRADLSFFGKRTQAGHVIICLRDVIFL